MQKLIRLLAIITTTSFASLMLAASIPKDLTPDSLRPTVKWAQKQLSKIGLEAGQAVFIGKVSHRWVMSHHCFQAIGEQANKTSKLLMYTGTTPDCSRPSFRITENERDLMIELLFYRELQALNSPNKGRRDRTIQRIRNSNKAKNLSKWICRNFAPSNTQTKVHLLLTHIRRQLENGKMIKRKAVIQQFDCATDRKIEGPYANASELFAGLNRGEMRP